MLNLIYSVKSLQTMIHFSFQKLEMGFPKRKESENYYLTHSWNFHSQTDPQQVILICSPAVTTLSKIED